MSAHAYAVCSVLIAMLLGWELFEAKRDALRCRYCGAVKRHEQDCPYDFDQRT